MTYVNWSDVALHGVWLSAAALWVYAHFALEPARWSRNYLIGVNASPHSVRDVFYLTALASYLLPFKLGLPLRVVMLRRHVGLDTSAVLLRMALDAAITLAAWLALAALAATQFVASSWAPAWLPHVALVALIVLSAGLAWPRLRRTLWQRWQNARTQRLPRRALFEAGALALLDVATYGLRHVCLVAFACGWDALPWAAVAAAGVLATFAGIASGLPLGLVGYDASAAALLLLMGASPAQASVVIVINRALNLGMAFALGAPAAARLGLGRRWRDILRNLRKASHEAD